MDNEWKPANEIAEQCNRVKIKRHTGEKSITFGFCWYKNHSELWAGVIYSTPYMRGDNPDVLRNIRDYFIESDMWARTSLKDNEIIYERLPINV